MYSQEYRNCRFYLYVKKKGFAKTAFIIKVNKNNLELTLLTDLNFALLLNNGDRITFLLYCVKINRAKDIIDDLKKLRKNRGEYEPVFTKRCHIMHNYDNKHGILFIDKLFNIELYKNVYENKIYISNPFITIDKDLVDNYIDRFIEYFY